MGGFMRQSFKHIDASKRDFILQRVSLSLSYRSISTEMGRPASTISREVARHRCDAGGYEAIGAGSAAVDGAGWSSCVRGRLFAST